MIKFGLTAGLIGHILCAISDCLLSYSKTGRLDFRDIRDPEKMAGLFADMPPEYPLVSMILGTFAITLFGFGYFALTEWMKPYSGSASLILFVSAVVFLVPIVVHHVICGIVEWVYIRLERTEEARSVLLELQNKTIITMFAGYGGWLVFLSTLFYMIVTERTGLPSWCCIFNTAVFMVVLLPTKLPGKGNIAGALMFLGLLAVI